jgi:hypothetical protein
MRKFFVIVSITTFCFAKSGADIVKELKINPASKAMKQWERMFSDEEKLKKIGAEKLSSSDKNALKDYLVKHAADSDQPTVAGN